jgi:hypothetical protein
MGEDPMLEELVHETRRDELAGRIVRHWQLKVDAAPLERDPFDHFYVDGIWPDDVYAQILMSFPDKKHYVPINLKQWVRAKGESTRDRISLTNESIGKFEPGLREFWMQIWRALSSEEFKRLIFSKLKGDLALRLDVPEKDVVDCKLLVGAQLTRDTEDYRIKPHPDGYPRAVTMQFYLPSDMSQIDLGTSLYVRQPIMQRLAGNRFKEVKKMSFRPNSGYAFAVNDRKERCSLHGRELIKAGAGDRNSLLMSWYAEAPATNKSSTPKVFPTHSLNAG